MKYSQKLNENSWYYNKRKSWGEYIKLSYNVRKQVYNNRFENYCKELITQLPKHGR